MFGPRASQIAWKRRPNIRASRSMNTVRMITTTEVLKNESTRPTTPVPRFQTCAKSMSRSSARFLFTASCIFCPAS